MTETESRTIRDVLKVALAFLNAFCGVLVAYPGPEVSPLIKVMGAAMIAGCGAALLLLTPPGREASLTAKQRREAVAAVKQEMTRDPDGADPVPMPTARRRATPRGGI